MAQQDPEGKRISRERAELAQQALEFLSIAAHRIAALENPSFTGQIIALQRDLRRFHGEEVGKGSGHLEPRKKYKGRSQHLATEHGRGVITLYLDESGQAQPTVDQPTFVLAGIAMDDESASSYVRRANALKRRYGLSPDICLHGPQIEKGVDEFSFGGDIRCQESFRRSVKRLCKRAKFQLLGAILRKDQLYARPEAVNLHGNLPPNLYEMALTFVAERFVDMLHADQVLKPCGQLTFESIGNLEDAQHQRAFAELLIYGSEFVSDGCFRGWLRPGCEFRTKRGSHPLELADLAARAMLTWMRQGRPDDHDFWRIWAPRIATREEIERGKFGVKIFPDADIRGEVLALRRQVKSLKGEA